MNGKERITDDFVRDVHSVVISGHIKPDGDCIGSVLALYNYLKRNFPDVKTDLYLEEPSAKYRFLPGFDKIRFACDTDERYDLMIVLDCSTRERLGDAARYFSTAGHTVCLDHHISNEGFADENYISADASSACEVLYGYLDPLKIDRDIAMCLYAGIVSDTGVFKYPSATPATMRVAASLMEYDIPKDYIIDETFYARDPAESRILGYALLNARLTADGRIAYVCITQEDMDRFGVTTRELDGIVSELRLIRGVVCSVFLYQTGSHQYKVSLRSEDPVDVNAVASVFGGGGHIRAAGCTLTGDPDTCLEAILTETQQQTGGI